MEEDWKDDVGQGSSRSGGKHDVRLYLSEVRALEAGPQDVSPGSGPPSPSLADIGRLGEKNGTGQDSDWLGEEKKNGTGQNGSWPGKKHDDDENERCGMIAREYESDNFEITTAVYEGGKHEKVAEAYEGNDLEMTTETPGAGNAGKEEKLGNEEMFSDENEGRPSDEDEVEAERRRRSRSRATKAKSKPSDEVEEKRSSENAEVEISGSENRKRTTIK